MFTAVRLTSGMVGLLPALALASCAVGPNFTSPMALHSDSYTASPLLTQTPSTDVVGGEAQTFRTGQDVSAQWWGLFDSDKLNALVSEAVANYPTLRAQQAAMRQARANVRAQFGVFFPQITGAASDTGSREVGISSHLAAATVNVSYVFDIFGGARRQLEALQAAVDYQRYEYEGSYLTLTSTVVTTAIQVASLNGQLSATRDIISEDEQQLSFIQRKLDVGNETLADVLQQRSALASVRATLPGLEQSLAQAQHLLAVLIGRSPDDPDARIDFELADLTLPRDLPVSVPSQLLKQRPDIRAQEALMHEASAQIGVATAAMLPQLNLTGEYGGQSAKISDLLKSSYSLSSLAGNLTTPIFEGGTLRAQRDAKVEAFRETADQYRQTVLAAFQNVADALTALHNDADALKPRYEALSAGKAGLDLVQEQFDSGAVDYVSLLTAQQQYQQARISYVQALASRYSDTAKLFQALGGGWWNRLDAVAAPAAALVAQGTPVSP